MLFKTERKITGNIKGTVQTDYFASDFVYEWALPKPLTKDLKDFRIWLHSRFD
jgi:hypothetical protein